MDFADLVVMMAPAFAMCLVLTGIHGYLGIHVLERKVIFVDLALAQIAALGGIYAMWLGYDMHTEPGRGAVHTIALFERLGWAIAAPPDAVMIYVFSLLFALAGAAVFAVSRMRVERVPQEAFIGVTFATAVALAILLLMRVQGGSEHIRNMLVRDALMFATWPQVGKTALLYGVVGGVHVAFRRRFFRITLDPDGARAEGLRIRWWDFLFYVTFGFVITSSVSIAGVLLVFSYLVVPAAIAVLFAERVPARIGLAWASGFAASVAGLLACAAANRAGSPSPPGPWVVAVFALMLVVAGSARALRDSPNRLRSAARIAAGCLLAAALYGLSVQFRKTEHAHGEDPLLAALEEGAPQEQVRALDMMAERADRHYVGPVAGFLLRDPPAEVVEHAVKVLAALGDRAALPALRHTAARDLDPVLRAQVARAMASLGDTHALDVLLEILRSDASPFSRADGANAFGELTGVAVDPLDPASVDAAARWLEENRHRLRWNPSARRFLPSPD